jgi:phosphoribosyl-dephospho-CoA transferase
MIKTNLPCVVTRPHDLLELKSPESLHDFHGAPAWVAESLSACPYVVVRRKLAQENVIAVGVRGATREKRWPGFVSPARVKTIVPPSQLRACATIKPERLAKIPALRHLLVLEQMWCDLDLQWGPGGSVGFELASATPVATPLSDLDIVLFAPISFDHPYAHYLQSCVRQIGERIDVLVETPLCAFSLDEYADNPGRPILLRCLDNPRMAVDPWVDPCLDPGVDPRRIENAPRSGDSSITELEMP